MTPVESQCATCRVKIRARATWGSVCRRRDSRAPQAFLYREGSETRFGADLSRLVSQSIVVYAEWSGGNAASLAEQASAYGKATGTLPARVAAPPLGDSGRRFRSALAAGASWTSGPTTKLTINAEYRYDDAAFTSSS